MKDKHIILTTYAVMSFFILAGGLAGYKAGYTDAEVRCGEKIETIEKVKELKYPTISSVIRESEESDTLEISNDTIRGCISLEDIVEGDILTDTVYFTDVDSLPGGVSYYRLKTVGTGEDVVQVTILVDSTYVSEMSTPIEEQ